MLDLFRMYLAIQLTNYIFCKIYIHLSTADNLISTLKWYIFWHDFLCFMISYDLCYFYSMKLIECLFFALICEIYDYFTFKIVQLEHFYIFV